MAASISDLSGFVPREPGSPGSPAPQEKERGAREGEGQGGGSAAGGLGSKRSCYCLPGRGRETHRLTWGGQEGALPNPKCGHSTLGGEGYQGGKWGTRKPSPPTSKKEEEACNIQRMQNIRLSRPRTAARPSPNQPSVSPGPRWTVSGALFPSPGGKQVVHWQQVEDPRFLPPFKNSTLAGSRRSGY